MKVVPPRLKRLELKGSFGFDLEFFAAQKRVFESIVGRPATASYSLQVRSGAKYEVDTLEGLELLPFNDVRGRSSFSAEYESARQSLKIEIRYWRPAWVSISGWSEHAAERIAQESASAIEARRLWYSWIFQMWVEGLVALPVGAFLGTLLQLGQMSPSVLRWTLLGYGAYFLLVGLAFGARRFLFDTVVVTIGTEAARQVTLAKSRGYLFGTLAGGIAITLIGTIAAALITRP